MHTRLYRTKEGMKQAVDKVVEGYKKGSTEGRGKLLLNSQATDHGYFPEDGRTGSGRKGGRMMRLRNSLHTIWAYPSIVQYAAVLAKVCCSGYRAVTLLFSST